MEKDFQELNNLIELFQNSKLNRLEYSKGDLAIKLCKEPDIVTISGSNPNCAAMTDGQGNLSYQMNKDNSDSDKLQEKSNEKTVKSPIVGVYYEAKEPGASPFVKVGDTVEKNQVLCIIESMKMMLEVKSESAGVVKEILSANGEIVEYGQSLFVLEEADA